MGDVRSESSAEATSSARFAATHWSVVLAAGQGDSPERAVALETLCRNYREVIRGEIAQTVATPFELEEEMGYLLKLLCQ